VSSRRPIAPQAVGGAAEPSDPEIMKRLSRGESGALGDLYDRYHERLRQFLARATADAEDVDDLVHATFLAAAGSAARYDGRACARPWLVGIAVQHLRRRRQARGRFFAALSALARVGRAAADPRATMAARGDLERALALLTEPKRIAVLMAEVEEMSCPEIAAALDIPVGTVWTRLHAARRELRRALEGPERDEAWRA
jgi:RNA polymerase sigma-70 factor, ECF subfamily